MQVNGGVIQGVAKATAPIRDGDKGRPWRDVIAFVPGEGGVLMASDGFLAVRATVPEESSAKGFLRRRDALRVTPEDAVNLDTTKGDGDELFHEISVVDSELKMDLERAFGEGAPYPPEIAEVFSLFPAGKPALRFDPKSMRRAMYAAILAGLENVELFLSPKVGNGLIFIRGTNEDGVQVMLAMGYPKTAERKRDGSDTVVQVLEPTPLFKGAEAPAAPTADPGEPEPPPQD